MALSIPENDTLQDEAARLLTSLENQRNLKLSTDTGQQLLSTELSQLFSDMLTKLAAGQKVEVQTVRQDLTTTEAAQRLGVSRPTLVKLIKNGELPAHKVGKHYRLDLVHLQNYVKLRYEKKIQQVKGLWDFEEEHELTELITP